MISRTGGHLRKTKNYSGMRGMNIIETTKAPAKMGKGNYMATIKKKRQTAAVPYKHTEAQTKAGLLLHL